MKAGKKPARPAAHLEYPVKLCSYIAAAFYSRDLSVVLFLDRPVVLVCMPCTMNSRAGRSVCLLLQFPTQCINAPEGMREVCHGVQTYVAFFVLGTTSRRAASCCGVLNSAQPCLSRGRDSRLLACLSCRGFRLLNSSRIAAHPAVFARRGPLIFVGPLPALPLLSVGRCFPGERFVACGLVFVWVPYNSSSSMKFEICFRHWSVVC